MMIKCFYPNKEGKIIFTKEELEKLLDEVYEQGKKDGESSYRPYWWSSPSWTTTSSNITIDNINKPMSTGTPYPNSPCTLATNTTEAKYTCS